MSLKTEKLVLILVSICLSLLLVIDYMMSDSYVSVLLILLGVTTLIIAWVKYFKKAKK